MKYLLVSVFVLLMLPITAIYTVFILLVTLCGSVKNKINSLCK